MAPAAGQGAASALGGGRPRAGRLDPSHPFMSPDVGQLITNLLLQLPFSRWVCTAARRPGGGAASQVVSNGSVRL